MIKKDFSKKSQLSVIDSGDNGPKTVRRPYSPPASVQLAGSKDDEYGAAIGAAVLWVIGIGWVWIW